MRKWGSLIALFFLVGCTTRSDSTMYEAIFGEIHPDVTVLNATDQAFLDCCIWLHFKTSERALAPLLDSFEMKETHLHQWDDLNAPEWWRPDLMGRNVAYWEKRTDRSHKAFYINAAHTEVYYVDQAGH